MLLIGGPPGAGKTSLGRAVAAELSFGSITVDDLVITGQVLTTKETHPALHQMRPIGHTRYFTESPPDQLIADAAELEETMWPALERVIRSHATTNTPTVLDWWLLSPNKVDELEADTIASIWLYVDPDVLEEWERSNAAGFWAESSDPEQMIARFMRRSLWRNELVASQARELGLPVLYQSGADTVEDLVEAVLEIVGAR